VDVTVERSPVLGLPLINYRAPGDSRGDFAIPIELAAMSAAGFELSGPIQQLNLSVSDEAFTTRGLHVSATGKLIFAPLKGDHFFNVVADLRDPDSPTFGCHETFWLEPGLCAYVPAGFGNGLQNQTSGALYCYALDGIFYPSGERVVKLDDRPSALTGRSRRLISRPRMSSVYRSRPTPPS
jgi:dTDP-4-dehydrorhamnose 3,5-epimerase-like enzyme